jgi:hypothetical protein
MSTLAIEINDASIVVADDEGIRTIQPGYALFGADETLTGRAAFRRARLEPARTSNRFWSELRVEDGGRSSNGRHPGNAALAYAQLSQIWGEHGASADDAVLLVPGTFGPDQLGLLLGIAQECGMPVRAMLDSALAASVKPYPGSQLLYVDAGLHQITVTPLRQDDNVAVEPVRSLESAGLAALADLVARRVAQAFVYSTRFDPFHRAETEQHLYDRLADWLDELETEDSIEVTIPHDGEEFSATVEREDVRQATGGFCRALVQLIAQTRESDRPLVVQLSHRLAGLPGLDAELARLDDAEILVLPAGQAARSALSRLDAIVPSGDEVRLLRRLPWHDAADVDYRPRPVRVQSPAPADTRAATHIVYRGIAYPLSRDRLFVGRAEIDGHRTIVIDDQQSGISSTHCELRVSDGVLNLRDLSRYGTFVNEKRVAGEISLRPADIIRVGSPGAELQVVRVENNDGT